MRVINDQTTPVPTTAAPPSCVCRALVVDARSLLFLLVGKRRRRASKDVKGKHRPQLRGKRKRLTAEAVEGAALPLEGVDDVERGDSLALGVLGVGDGVTDDTLEEGLEDTAGLLVDHGGNTLDTATTSETADGGLGDTLDVVAKNLAMTLGAALAETLAAFATSSHFDGGMCLDA
jgi:hypothetical protein